MFECDYRYQCPFIIKILDLNENSLINPNLPFELSAWPAWSPDGTKIAFYAFNDDKSGIYIMDVNSKEVTNLTHGLGSEEGLAWSPDGKKIAFSSKRDGNWDIYVMDADGSHQINLTNNPADDRFPDWCCQKLLINIFSLSSPLFLTTISIFGILLIIKFIKN